MEQEEATVQDNDAEADDGVVNTNNNEPFDHELPSDGDEKEEEEEAEEEAPMTTTEEADEDDDEVEEEEEQTGSNSQGEVSIGWDDDLCRPVFIRQESDGSSSDVVVSSEGDDDEEENGEEEEERAIVDKAIVEETTDGDHTATPAPFVLPEALENAKKRGRKRTKTFGSREVARRPLSLVLSQEASGAEGCESDNSDTEQIVNKRVRTDNGSDNVDSLATLAPASFNTNTRRISSSPILQDHDDSGDENKDAFAFPAGSSDVKKTGSVSPLKRARAFFEDLDKTQKLTVDASFSPTVSGKVVRTSRRFDFTSPRVNQAYEAYVEATEASGVAPLSIRDFVKSRNLRFETKGGELFDGFLDDC